MGAMKSKLHCKIDPTLMKGAFCNPCLSHYLYSAQRKKHSFPGKEAQGNSLKERETVSCDLLGAKTIINQTLVKCLVKRDWIECKQHLL